MSEDKSNFEMSGQIDNTQSSEPVEKNPQEQIEALSAQLDCKKQESERIQEAFHDAIELLDDGFVIYDKDDKLVTYNTAFKEQFGSAGDFLEIGKTYKHMTSKFARSGIIPDIKGKEDEFVNSLIEKRNSEVGVDKIFQNHEGAWIRQRDKRNASGNLVGLRTDITELKNREQELASTSDMFINATNAMVQGIVIFKHGKIQFFNPVLTDLLNISKGDLEIGFTFEAFLEALKSKGHYENDDAVVERNLEILLSGEKHQIQRKTHYGTILRIDVLPTGDDDVIVTYTDITEAQTHQTGFETVKAELENTSTLQAKISNAIAQGIVMFEHGKVVFFNNQVLELLELSEEILFTGQSFDKFLSLQIENNNFNSAEDAQEHFRQHLEAASGSMPYQLERTTNSGKTIRVDGVPNEEAKSLTLTFTDITALKAREKELDAAKQVAERMSQIQEAWTNAMIPGLIIFNNNILSYLNPRTLELLGAKEGQLEIGMPIEDVVKVQKTFGDFSDEHTDDDYEKKLNQQIKEGRGYTFERKMLNGKTLQVDGVHTDNNSLVVSYTDITEAKIREEKLREATALAESAERAKSEFLANMSHEIRTPMNGVMGMAELLATTELDSKQKMFTDVIVKSGASLLTIINDILDFSKIDAGQMELDHAPFALAEAIEDVATLVSSKVAEKDLELIVRVDPALPKMMIGDVGRLRQIVTNLLGNAVKFTEKGHVFVNIEGTVAGQSEDKIANLKFSIEDTGIGIPKEKCAQVFSKFSQVDTSATRKHEGTGLGLSISSSLVKLMNGEIGVDSEVGKGSVFWFEVALPVHAADDKKQIIPGNMSGARVLVIDDNAVNRSILTEQMTAWNFDGAATSSGKEGLEVMRAVISNKMTLDLVILDYQMPEMSGAEVLETMRNDEMLKDIPVVMLTSVDSSQTNQRLAQLGAEANLTKPTRSSMLLETILQVIANKRADVETRINNLSFRQISDPAHAVAHPQEELQEKVGKSPTLEPAQLDILVAEDNEVNQIVFRQILEETGLNFKIVENGLLAFAAFKVQKPRLVLMDVSMPEMNGKEATKAIRRYERENQTQRVPIVGVTAHALKGDMEACIDAGMDDYLSKPVSPNKLTLKIEQWLKVNLGSYASGM